MFLNLTCIEESTCSTQQEGRESGKYGKLPMIGMPQRRNPLHLGRGYEGLCAFESTLTHPSTGKQSIQLHVTEYFQRTLHTHMLAECLSEPSFGAVLSTVLDV